MDSVGLPLPDGSWPDAPGSAGALEGLRRLCNSVNREHGADAWRSVGELSSWLRAEGYATVRPTRDDLGVLRHLRQALWESMTKRSLQPLDGIVDTVVLTPVIADGTMTLRGSSTAADVVGAALFEAILCAQHDGSWGRLKACQHCHWVFYDGSRNRTGRWCSMGACGSRQKARAYRQRHARVSAAASVGPSTTAARR